MFNLEQNYLFTKPSVKLTPSIFYMKLENTDNHLLHIKSLIIKKKINDN
jgi:hypothetical protein